MDGDTLAGPVFKFLLGGLITMCPIILFIRDMAGIVFLFLLGALTMCLFIRDCRKRYLYTNNPIGSISSLCCEHSTTWRPISCWNNIELEHPASFDTLAVDPAMKQEIMADLNTFLKGKQYYSSIGKAWMRSYLLYGPPETSKSAIITAMANYMNYNIYNINLTIVKSDSDLVKLLMETSRKSIIVFEDIEYLDGSRATLSGLLNFIEGPWSAHKEERLIVFTTNHMEKLEQALTRGRMDKLIHISYCSFEVFKVLALRYMGIHSHRLFKTINTLLGQAKVTTAYVTENLRAKSPDQDCDTRLDNLIYALGIAIQEAASISSQT